jgi:tetratricopeptide (TPR) repeat protein
MVAHHRHETPKEDSLYIAGVIYIDPQAGFTADFGVSFAITNKGLEKRDEYSDAMFKIRLYGKNIADVAILSDKEIKQLGLPKEPDWLKHYGKNAGTNLHSVKQGLFYNSVGESHKAIELLLKVYNKEPHFEGLEFELAYAYNATKDFDKAITILNKAIKNNPKNYKFYMELGFSFINQNKLADAEKTYLEAIELATKKAQESQAEMAYNMAYSYFQIRNKSKFEEWAKLTRKYAYKNSQLYNSINLIEKNWNK